MSILRRFIFLCVAIVAFSTGIVSAQELQQDIDEVMRARVDAILNEERRSVAGGDTYVIVQTIRVSVLSGSKVGKAIELENDLMPLSVGEKIYINHLSFMDGSELYSVRGIDRKNGILLMIALFAGAVIAFGGRQGLRSLVSLVGSFILIVFVLFPLYLKGYSPLLVSAIVGSAILGAAIMATHGVHVRSVVAWSGATISIIFTALVAIFGTDLLHLSGFFSDETVFLNLNTHGTLDFKGLLLGSIVIGVLGVLDDIAITQVAVVSELRALGSSLSRRELYDKAIRVGREHVSALVNTIVLAYAGVSLPLLLLFSQSGTSLVEILNNEVFATEIVRTIAGSIGLIATVPITTALAAYFADRLGGHDTGSVHHHHA